MTKLQEEQLANLIPVEETIPKKELMSLLECPVCLDHFKPPLQVYKILFFLSIDPLSTFLQIWQCPEGHVICWSCKIRPELKGCPQCRVVKYRNFSRNRILEELSRKMFPEKAWPLHFNIMITNMFLPSVARTYAATVRAQTRGNSTFLQRVLWLSVYCWTF